MARAVAERLEELRRRRSLEGDGDGGTLLAELYHGVEPRLAKTRRGITLVHYACQRGWLDFVKSLIQEHNCDPHAKTHRGLTPLHYACRYGRFDIVCYLTCEQHCDPDCCDNDQWTPLHWLNRGYRECTLEEAVKIVRFLISLDRCDVNRRTQCGSTAFLLACHHEATAVARCLMNVGHCDVTIPDNDGNTALHACHKNKTDDKISKLLLEEAKIDPNAKNNDGDTPLHLACRGRNSTLVQLLVRDDRCNPHEKDSKGDTALHVSCRHSQGGGYISKLLLKETNVDPNAKNKRGCTPLDLTSDPGVIRELIRHGANPQDVYKTHGKVLGKHSSKQPLETPVKVFMVGNPSAGKSTLTKALQSELTGFKRLVKRRSKPVSGVDEKTAGIVPHEFESKMYGRVTLYDFAGQREFYGSHAALLQNAIQTSTPIFLLVVDLSQSNEDLKQSIFYWLSFLENQCTSVSSKPHLVIIGSHADMLRATSEDPKRKGSLLTAQAVPQFPSLEFTGFVAMDCQYADSDGMTELHHILKTSCDSLRKQENINFNAHCFLIYLLDKFREATAITIQQIQNEISEGDKASSRGDDINYFLPQTSNAVENACDQLNDRGHLLVLKNITAIENGWVIINRTALLAEVNGTIFAPEGFKEHIKLASSTGVVPLSSIAKHFPKHDLTMLVGFLSHLEFCHEISDVEVLGLINQEQASTACEATSVQGECYFFFPGLVTLEVPSTVWEPQPQFAYHCGWILQCSQPEQFFGPRFLQVLLLRLAFCFAFRKHPSTDVPSLQRKCSIWKNGIYWGDRYGTEIQVEITEQNRVVVLMRCREINSEYLQLRSLLIQKVLAAAREFCSKVSTVESFITPSDTTQYPLKPTSELTLYDISEVATAVAKCTPSVVGDSGRTCVLDSLLSFEPYADLGEPILRELLDEDSSKYKQKISNIFISNIAERIPQKKAMVKKLFKPRATLLAHRMAEAALASDETKIIQTVNIWREQTEGTYQCLRGKLDQFSVFAGRNPLEIAGVSCESRPQQPSTDGSSAVSLEIAPAVEHVVFPADVDMLAELLSEVAAHWDLFLGQIGLPSHVRDEIRNENSLKAKFSKRCLLEGLRHWVESVDMPTYGRITAALRGDTVCNIALARRVEGFAESRHSCEPC